MLTYTFQSCRRGKETLLQTSQLAMVGVPDDASKIPTRRFSGESRLFCLTIIESALHTKIAQYQIYMKYMLFNPVLQDLYVNLSPFVVNVIALLAIKRCYQDA